MIEIRAATPADAGQIVAFQIDMARETENMQLDKATVTLGVRGIYDHPERGSYWIAQAEGKIVGSLLTIPEWSDWRNGTVLWIHSVFVTQQWRRKGVFRAMYGFLKNRVEKDSSLKGLRLYVHKDNSPAQSTYADLGMDGEHYRLFEWMKS